MMPHALIPRCLRAAALPALLSLAVLPVLASPVTIPMSSFTFAPGAGYGVDADEKTGTLLDVVFAATLSPHSFDLTLGQPHTFAVGTVRLREQNEHSGITTDEIDALDISATLSFDGGFLSPLTFTALVTATTGSVNDAAADLVIDWTPQLVAFGTGGWLEISLADLTFTTQQFLTQHATISLLAAPQAPATPADQTVPTSPTADQPQTNVPEPASLALLAAGLVGLAATRRGRRGRRVRS